MDSNGENGDLKQALKILGFQSLSVLPKLQEIRKAFFNIARQNHPDKNSKEDNATKESRQEYFKTLLNAYNYVAEIIIENDSSPKEEEEDDDEFETEDQPDDEICYTAEEFKNVNIVETNTRSVTVTRPKAYSWPPAN